MKGEDFAVLLGAAAASIGAGVATGLKFEAWETNRRKTLQASRQLKNGPVPSQGAARQAAIERRLATNVSRDAQHPSRQSDKFEPWVDERARMVKTVTDWLDSVAAEVGPDPRGASSPEEFIAQLRLLRAWAGDPTLRQLENRAGTGRLPRSSISDMLRRTNRLPKIDLVTEFVKACGAGAALPAWIAAWHRLSRARVMAQQQAA